MLQTNLIRYRALIISLVITMLLAIVAAKLAFWQCGAWIFVAVAFVAALFGCIGTQSFIKKASKEKIHVNSSKYIVRLIILAVIMIGLFVFSYANRVFSFEELHTRIEDGVIVRDPTHVKIVRGLYYSEKAKVAIRDKALSPDQPAEVLKHMGGTDYIDKTWSPLSTFLSVFLVQLFFALAVLSITAAIAVYVEDFLYQNSISLLAANVEPAAGQAKTLFLSYSHNDNGFALKLANDISEQGTSVWIDKWDIKVGMGWTNEIERAIDNSDIFLLLVSPAAIKSKVVNNEIMRATGKDKPIFAVVYIKAELPLLVNTKHVIFYKEPYDAFLKELIAEIKTGYRANVAT